MSNTIILPEEKQRGVAAEDDDNLFPALASWKNRKIRDLAYCVATFFNYVSIPRDGFLKVSRESGADTTAPVISLDLCQYVLREIFPCLQMTKEQTFTVFRVSNPLQEAIEKFIRKNVNDKSFTKTIKSSETLALSSGNVKNFSVNLPKLEIQLGVIQAIWTYVSNGVNALAYESQTNEEVQEKIEEAERMNLQKRNALKNYGFNDDLENSAFQALLYVIVALMDWLEIDIVTRAEIEHAYKILFPRNLQTNLVPIKNTTLSEIISRAFVGANLIPTDEAVELASNVMNQIRTLMEENETNSDARRVIGRFMAFSQPV
jgi:hypothetical protein